MSFFTGEAFVDLVSATISCRLGSGWEEPLLYCWLPQLLSPAVLMFFRGASTYFMLAHTVTTGPALEFVDCPETLTVECTGSTAVP